MYHRHLVLIRAREGNYPRGIVKTIVGMRICTLEIGIVFFDAMQVGISQCISLGLYCEYVNADLLTSIVE